MKRKIMAFVLTLSILMSTFVPGTLATSAASDSSSTQVVVENQETTDNCPYCEETTAEDGTVTHAETCNTLFAYDGTADIGKYVKLNDYFAMVSVRYDVTSSDDYSYDYTDFETDQIFEIVNYHYEVETSGVWYLVKTYSGTMPTDTPEQIWILQNYTVDGDSENALLFVSTCEDCGKPDCTTNHNTPIMTKCAICGKENCTTQHLYCEEHSAFDCDATHTKQESSKPVTEPAIPANPTLTVGADVSIADEYGDPVTEDGFVLLEGTKSSLSAWSDSENVSYQWQIRTDDGTWVDIQGQTAQGILISPAMFVSVVNPAIRCEVTSGETVEYSAEIPVTVENSVANVSMFSLARTANNVAATAEDGTTTPELGEYTVVINYVFENNVVVADPYTATLAAGSNFSATVKNPTVMGYLPYVGDAAETSENVQLNITNIQADVTYTVTYKPTNVNYTVIHYWQNVDNDNYTIHETETLQGLTKSTVGEVAKAYPGMYALLYERPEIAADGSTVVEVYYDRNYYMMFFNLGEGGYGVDPVIYARYGAPVEIDEPTRPGYTFNGWDKDVPDTVPVDGGRYTAQWESSTTSFTVVYWYENADDDKYTSVGSVTVNNVASGSQVTSETYKDNSFENRDDDHFTYNPDKSETKTVDGDGSTVLNVYFTRNEYTITFTGVRGELTCTRTEHNHSDSCCENGGTSWSHWFHNDDCCKLGLSEHTHSDSCYDTSDYTITRKYDASISDVWTTDPIKSMLDDGYVFQSSLTGKYYSFLEKMPGDDITMKATLWSGNQYTWYYYLEVLPGADTSGMTIRTDNGKTYYEYDSTTVYGSNISLTYEEDYYPITGFTQRDSSVPSFSSRVAYLYYTRNSYDISFINYGTEVTNQGGTYLYGSDISNTSFTPSYPSTLEAGAYTFEGWYTSPYFGDTKFDFTDATMPANDLILYANWVPVTRTVEFYLDQDDMENNTDMLAKRETPHGSVLNPGVEAPTNGDYTFVGWFYMDGDEEKGFVDTMPITKDMKVYAKWSSNVLKEYTVYFKIQGTDTQIADPITGSGLAGITKTFDAKGGTDLYAGYQEGYFPLVESHSMTLNIEHENNQGDNTYTFWYVQKDAVPYKVYYVAETLKEGGTSLGTIERDGKTYHIIATTKEVNDNRKAVVTEKFEQVSGYMPDAYQKRLVVNGTEGAVNEIIFYYTVDSTHAYYKITHYTQNTDGENWTVYDERQFTGEIGQTYSAEPLTIDGFTYDPDAAGTLTSGNLTAEGLELKLYYVRNSYPYEVRYLEQGSGKQLADPKPGTGLYGAVVSESAIDIANYTAVDPTSQTLTIKIEEDATAKLNIITFYYTEQEVEIKYVAVGNGTVTDPSNTNTAGASGSETLKVLSGTAQGSTATANTNYKFVGWFDNEACAGEPISTDAKYVPTKVDGKNVAATYYAKFELDVADLTITKSGDISSYDENQSFIFRVTGPNGFSLDVVINGTGSVTIKDLPIGTYTVTEITDWSWRYTPDSEAKSITLGAGENNVEFANTRSWIYWLAGDSFNENQFTVKSKDDEN